MHAFQAVSGGWQARVEPHEAEAISQIMAALAALLSKEEVRDFEENPEQIEQDNVEDHPFRSLLQNPNEEVWSRHTGPLDASSTGQHLRRKVSGSRRQTRVPSDDDVLAELDFEPLSYRPEPLNPFVSAIIRPLSQDAQEAGELRALTMVTLCKKKREALATVAGQLRESARSGGIVMVEPEGVQYWLIALNDVRLALALALGVKDEASARRVNRIFEHPEDFAAASRDETVLATLYTALAWWQESLIEALSTP